MFKELSWMIYWAGALDKLGSLLTMATLILMCTSTVTIFLVPPMAEGSVDTDSTSKVWRHWRLKSQIVALVVCAFLRVFVPSSQTVYMMLATQVTGTVVAQIQQSPVAEKAVRLLEQKLDEALAEKQQTN